jgi:hypothetical protein
MHNNVMFVKIQTLIVIKLLRNVFSIQKINSTLNN